MYNEEEEDESDEPEKDEIIELGKDEDEYKQLRHEREEKKLAGVLCYKLGNSCQSDGDRKLLRYKYAWIIHQCVKCESMQKSQARDLFLQKIGMAYDRGTMYTLSFIVRNSIFYENNEDFSVARDAVL
uniref:Uncharacterized protein n=1 Tax=Meloidogyne javanica TaxID=6303 RepID=A0A915M5H4_MELJA